MDENNWHEINAALAVHCGWKLGDPPGLSKPFARYWWHPTRPEKQLFQDPPRFDLDLNLIREVEEKFTPQQTCLYLDALSMGIRGDKRIGRWAARHASAGQCALAAYQAIKGE